EEKAFLMDTWRKLRDETGRATEELGIARKEFAELLRTLQANEDFIDELMQIRQAQKALEVIRSLTKDIREASDSLKKLIGGIKPPGAGHLERADAAEARGGGRGLSVRCG